MRCFTPLLDKSDFCYLSLVTDYYTKEIVGYSVEDTLETKYPQEALEISLRHYAGKNELFMGIEFYGIREVRAAVKAAVDFYNHKRPHWSLDGMTPTQAAQCEGEVRKRWKSYR